jgi:hypothetical protein
MAKRTTPRSEANETSAAPSRPKVRRKPAVNTSPEADTIAAYPGVERSEDDTALGQALAGAEPDANSEGESPTEHDIRVRAYHRYLTRGDHQGSEFDDWVEAERELKKRR